jgi:antitoxin component YwqK of YwqJK toxin-antitoxin module
MRKFHLFFSLLVVSFTYSANAVTPANDSINKSDAAGLRQGKWVILNSDGRLEDCPTDKKVEEGNYADSKKNGTWFQFYCNGKIKNELNFINNQPNGYAKFYYSNGKLSEEGLWQNNVWVGGYKYYYENGQMAYEFNYNAQGKRDGVQKYYHENGKLKIEGNWAEGQESGVLKEYYDDGSPKSEKTFNNGHLDTNKVKIFVEKKVEPIKEEVKKEEVKVEPVKDVKPAGYLEDGFHKTFGGNKKVAQEGIFKNSILVDGKKYEYEGDKLIKTSIWKDGKIVDIKVEK